MRILQRVMAWLTQERISAGLAESLRDHQRREFAQGWEGPRWRFDRELAELRKHNKYAGGGR